MDRNRLPLRRFVLLAVLALFVLGPGGSLWEQALERMGSSDYDSGAGVANQTYVGLAIPASGGPAPITAANPLPTTSQATVASTVSARLYSTDRRTYTATFDAALGACGAPPCTFVQIIGPTSGNTEISEIAFTKPSGQTGVRVTGRSTALSGGTCAGVTPLTHDIGGTAATSVVTVCTADPTEGTPIAMVWPEVDVETTETLILTFADDIDMPPTLSAVTEALTVDVDGAGTFQGYIRWIER